VVAQCKAAGGSRCSSRPAAGARSPLQLAHDSMDVVSDSETVVLLSHRPVFFSTTVVQFVLAKGLALLYCLGVGNDADDLQKASDAYDQVIRLETCR